MSELGGQAYLDSLGENERRRLKETGAEMVKLAQKHSAAIIIAPPPSQQGRLQSASGCVLLLEGTHYLVTAAHVLAGFESRRATDKSVTWQVGDLVLNPLDRVAWRDDERDVLMLSLRATEAAMIPVAVASVSDGWPPPHPAADDFVLVSGYPAADRWRHDAKRLTFNALSAIFRVTTSGGYHLVCQWEREFFVSFEGPGVPPKGRELGGMSGAPVFRIGRLTYPLVGVVSEFQNDFELMRVSTLHPAPSPDGFTNRAR